MINETLEANRAYQKDKDDAYNRGYKQGKADTEKNIDTYIEALDRAKTLLKATWNLLQKQKNSIIVLNLLEEIIKYDKSIGSGYDLMDDINYWFDEFCDEELDNE